MDGSMRRSALVPALAAVLMAAASCSEDMTEGET
jgi:hypothetical protein